MVGAVVEDVLPENTFWFEVGNIMNAGRSAASVTVTSSSSECAYTSSLNGWKPSESKLTPYRFGMMTVSVSHGVRAAGMASKPASIGSFASPVFHSPVVVFHRSTLASRKSTSAAASWSRPRNSKKLLWHPSEQPGLVVSAPDLKKISGPEADESNPISTPSTSNMIFMLFWRVNLCITYAPELTRTATGFSASFSVVNATFLGALSPVHMSSKSMAELTERLGKS